MQQRQLRLGDILDDYCPRERRLTNHAVVAMVGDDVKQTRCTTCDAEHEYKHAKVPRQRRKPDSPAALYAQVARRRAEARHARSPPHRVADAAGEHDDDVDVDEAVLPDDSAPDVDEHADDPEVRTPLASRSLPTRRQPKTTTTKTSERKDEEGPVHRPLIRASLPRRRAAAAGAAGSRVHDPPAGGPSEPFPAAPAAQRGSRSRATARTATAARRTAQRGGARARRRRPSAAGSRWRRARHGPGRKRSEVARRRSLASARQCPCPISPENTASSSVWPTSGRSPGPSRRRRAARARGSR